MTVVVWAIDDTNSMPVNWSEEVAALVDERMGHSKTRVSFDRILEFASYGVAYDRAS